MSGLVDKIYEETAYTVTPRADDACTFVLAVIDPRAVG